MKEFICIPQASSPFMSKGSMSSVIRGEGEVRLVVLFLVLFTCCVVGWIVLGRMHRVKWSLLIVFLKSLFFFKAFFHLWQKENFKKKKKIE